MPATRAIIFPGRILVAPERIAEIERTGIGERANRGAADAADHRSGSGITGKRANGRTRARAKQAAGNCTVARRGSASAECKSGRENDAGNQRNP